MIKISSTAIDFSKVTLFLNILGCTTELQIKQQHLRPAASRFETFPSYLTSFYFSETKQPKNDVVTQKTAISKRGLEC